MAVVDQRPHPPGDYPVVVVGSGPGGLQTSYFLSRLGIRHALLSRDDAPAGMFRRFPLFDRLISWTKPNPDAEAGSREEEWFDWNRLLVEEGDEPVRVADLMDGTSEFPSREEMERSLARFAERKEILVRYGCAWEATRRDGERFVLETTDGEYRCRVAVFAMGVTEAWRPDIPGIEEVPHYMEVRSAKDYEGKSLYILGKATSAFEIADGLLPHARRMVLASPHGVRLSVTERSLAGLRARYMQPLEDHAMGGRSVLLLDAATDRIERTAPGGYRVHLSGTVQPWQLEMEFDEAIIATGVGTPVRDLPDLGVQMFSRGGRLPAQTPFWESPTVPGIYFAGSVTQGTSGLRRTTGAGAVHGFRYTARILAEHLAHSRFGVPLERPVLRPADIIPHLLREATTGPELWNQRAYLGRVLTYSERGFVDEGVQPLAHFVDATGPDAVAVAIVSDEERTPRAAVYVRRRQQVSEHLLDPSLTLDFTTADHEAQLGSVLRDLMP